MEVLIAPVLLYAIGWYLTGKLNEWAFGTPYWAHCAWWPVVLVGTLAALVGRWLKPARRTMLDLRAKRSFEQLRETYDKAERDVMSMDPTDAPFSAGLPWGGEKRDE